MAGRCLGELVGARLLLATGSCHCVMLLTAVDGALLVHFFFYLPLSILLFCSRLFLFPLLLLFSFRVSSWPATEYLCSCC